MTLFDAVTGQTREVSGICTFQWHEGNWSCDCNRMDYFGVDRGPDDAGRCLGGKRFVVVAATIENADDYSVSIGLLNWDYPPELVANCRRLFAEMQGASGRCAEG